MPPVSLPLKDIHLPQAVSAWPPALGWWILLLLMGLLAVAGVLLYLHRKRRTALRTAKKHLRALRNDLGKSNQQKIAELSILIRRVVISLSPDSRAAGLTAHDWLAYLDGSLKDKPFSNGIGSILAFYPYQKQAITDDELIKLFALCERWLKTQSLHRKR